MAKKASEFGVEPTLHEQARRIPRLGEMRSSATIFDQSGSSLLCLGSTNPREKVYHASLSRRDPLGDGKPKRKQDSVKDTCVRTCYSRSAGWMHPCLPSLIGVDLLPTTPSSTPRKTNTHTNTGARMDAQPTNQEMTVDGIGT